MSICARIVVAVTLHEVDSPPNAKTCAKRDNQSLQYTNCAVKEIHINLAFCRFAAQKMLLKMKMPPLFLGGCVLVGQIYFVYVKGFIGLYYCRAGRHIPFHIKSVFLIPFQRQRLLHSLSNLAQKKIAAPMRCNLLLPIL